MRNKKFLALILASAMVVGSAMAVSADTIDGIKAQQAQTQANLDSVSSYIDTLEQDKATLLGQIDSVDQELVTTIAYIDSLNISIEDINAKIDQTAVDLAAAEETKAVQYEAMKKRIQYIYEEGGNAGWATILLADGDITELLNKAEYTQQMYDYDRECLEEYAATVEQVETLQAQQTAQQTELVELKGEQEQYQQSLQEQLANLQATSSDYEAELLKAQELANQYTGLINQQNEQIAILVEQQRAAAEAAAAQAAAEEAARQQAAAQSAQQAATQTTTTTNGGGSSYVPDTTGGGSSDSGSSDSGSSGGSSYNSSIGQAIVSYACQFIGNPYVWGGTSLTNGADCSGFTQAVFAHFGYSLPRTSGEQRSAGYAVSYSEAQPGDLICYEGHVAIYKGGGSIVHAANESIGITTGSATYRSILSVRRIAS